MVNEPIIMFEIRITADALKDIDDIYNYISTVLMSPQSASSICAKIRKAILSLTYMPKRYSVISQTPNSKNAYRRINVGKYAIIYVVDNTTVTIIAVLYGASDIFSKLG